MAIMKVMTPVLPESVEHGVIGKWLKNLGDNVSLGEPLVELETDKIVLEIPSPYQGVLHTILAVSGSTVRADAVLATIDTEHVEDSVEHAVVDPIIQKDETPVVVKDETLVSIPEPPVSSHQEAHSISAHLSPSQRKDAYESGHFPHENVSMVASFRREKMSPLRQTMAQRLLDVQRNTAMLTTFNDVNMSEIIRLRKVYGDTFSQKHGAKLGFMAFFIKTIAEVLRYYPILNASIDGEDILYHNHVNISVAMSTEKGLVVPVLRGVERMTMAEIAQQHTAMVDRARAQKLTLDDFKDGTFTLTNGGVFGSLLSTPLINPPRCAILGMHRIEERPVVKNGGIIIAPMMYIAASYDHCLVDGKDAVGFLKHVKDILECPEMMIME